MLDDPAARPPSVFDAEDLVDAVADLCSRAGAHSVEIGYSLRSGIPGRLTGTPTPPATGRRSANADTPARPPPATRSLATWSPACAAPASSFVALDSGENLCLTRPWAPGARWSIRQARDAGWCLWQPYMKRWRPACGMLPFEPPGRAGGASGKGARRFCHDDQSAGVHAGSLRSRIIQR